MTSGRIPQLELAQTVALMRACLDNAEGLRAGAESLFDNGRYELATYLYAVSLEELGKLPMLARCPQFKDDKALWKDFWKRFKSHTWKLASRPGALRLALLYPEVARISAWFWDSMDLMKQRALYVDFQHGDILTPQDLPIWRDIASALRLALEMELPSHRFIVGHITQDHLWRIASGVTPDGQPQESLPDYLARTLPEQLAKFGIEVVPREPTEDSLSYVLKVYGPIFKALDKIRWDEPTQTP